MCQILIISPFAKNVTKVTTETAEIRNRLMIDLANRVVLGYIDPNGNLFRILKDMEDLKGKQYKQSNTESLIMENTVYYTFSTISQSLAAMVALLGVFTIYILQTLNSKIIYISQGYLEYLNNLGNDKNPNTGIWFVNRELKGLIISKT